MDEEIRKVLLVNTRRQPCEIMSGQDVLLLGPMASTEIPEDLLESPVLARMIARHFLQVKRLASPQPANQHRAKASSATRKSKPRAPGKTRITRKSRSKTAKTTD